MGMANETSLNSLWVCPYYSKNRLYPTYRPEGPPGYLGEPVPTATSSRDHLGMTICQKLSQNAPKSG